MKDVQQFLDFPSKVASQMGGDKYVTISMAINAHRLLLGHLESHADSNTPAISQCIQPLRKYYEKYKTLLAQEPARIAQFLDPRLSKPEKNSQEWISIIALIKLKLNTDYQRQCQISNQASDNADDVDSDGALDLFQLSNQSVGVSQRPNGPKFQLNTYLDIPLIPFKTDPIQFWTDNEHDITALRDMAFDFLAILASSVPAERANSTGERVFQDRLRLHDSVFKAEVCSKSWLKILKAAKISLPKDFRAEFDNFDQAQLEEMALTDICIEYLLCEGQL